MNTGRYGSLRTGQLPLKETGYLKAWISVLTDITTLQEPVLTTPTPVIGEAYTIGTDHEFATGKEPMAVLVRADTLEAPGESSGEIGSQRMVYSPKIFIKGDGPIAEEVLQNLLNEQLILWVQDECSPAKFIQFGCDCTPAEIQKRSFSSGTLTGGQKGNEVTIRSFCRFFYTGTLPERA